jgi:hypothetical protein
MHCCKCCCSNRTGGWLTGLRPWPLCGHAVAPIRWPWAHWSGREGPKAATKPTARPSLHFRSSSPSVCSPRWRSRRPLPLQLCPAHAPLSPRHCPKSTAPSFAITFSSFSTPPWNLSSQGEGVFSDYATAAMCGTSPEFEAAMVGVARIHPILHFPLL